ncbi:MAG: NDP-sugar synthase [Candidatus Eremiobacteraeota bacterium]|nr:NDP-sugar synthase [Candidatus Eremiobacteraeota bacterium]
MKSIILAAGFGTRLLPLTKERPKSLFPVLNKPVIEIQIQILKRAGVDKIGINLHYMPHQIKAYLGNGESLGVQIEYKYEKEILNTGGGLSNFRDFIGDQEDFIVHNCDILSNIDLYNALKCHKEKKSIVTFILVDNPPANSVLIDKNMKIIDIAGRLGIEAREEDKYLCGSGIFIYNKRIFDYIPLPHRPFPLIPEIIEIIQNQPGTVNAYIPGDNTYWRDIGSLKQYFLVNSEILTGRFSLQKINIPGEEIPGNGLLIGKNCDIPGDVEISGFACIGDNVKIDSGCNIENCIIWDGAILKRGIYRNMIISQQTEIYI